LLRLCRRDVCLLRRCVCRDRSKLTLRRFEDDYQVTMLSCARCVERRHAIVPLCAQVDELVGEGGYGVVRKCVRHGDVL
jgi:hypothetical protein